MNTLIVGANGLLGSNVVVESDSRGHRTFGTYHSTNPDLPGAFEQCDLRDTERFRKLLGDNEVDLLINCAALTDVDQCERTPRRAREINGEAPGELATLCNNLGIRFVHISTDYVFDGETNDAYDETTEPNPIQVYGASKRRGERKVLNANPEALVLRLSFVYGIHRSSNEPVGFPAWVSDELRSGNELPLFVDQYVTPSRAGQVAETVFELHEVDTSGIVHVASRSCVTPYQFGRAIARQMDVSGTFEESNRSDVDREAERPEHTCLDVSKLEELCRRRQPTVTEDLSDLFTALDYS